MWHVTRRFAVILLLIIGLVAPALAAPQGEMTWAIHVSHAPAWFDPAETPSVITPFMILYALHDAVVKPMPGTAMAPSLAESGSVSKDGLAYEFVLRKGVRFHNGDPVTADDGKLSLERYRGTSTLMSASGTWMSSTRTACAFGSDSRGTIFRDQEKSFKKLVRPGARRPATPPRASKRS